LLPYVGLEAAASVIRTYEVQSVPGLLQTRDYARALIRRGSVTAEEEIARRVELRLRRQEILARPNPPQLSVVIDESALRRPVGSREITREQVRHLASMADSPAITVQILPFSAGAHPAMGGPFTILQFAEPDLNDLVYVEQLSSAVYLDKPAETAGYQQIMERLRRQAEPPARTAQLLQGILAEA
jgi:hypothetical protein